MEHKKEKTFRFVIVGGGIAGVTCVEQVKIKRTDVTQKLYINVAIYVAKVKGYFHFWPTST